MVGGRGGGGAIPEGGERERGEVVVGQSPERGEIIGGGEFEEKGWVGEGRRRVSVFSGTAAHGGSKVRENRGGVRWDGEELRREGMASGVPFVVEKRRGE